jgi:hypothetical protein
MLRPPLALRSRSTRIAAVSALIGAAAVLAAGSTGAAQAATAAPTFGTPVVVDHFRPGYEPDIAVDASKTASRGHLFSTWPNGFSTTISYILRSEDQGRSFHQVESNAVGKPGTCIGGGDTDVQISKVDGSVVFADLQGLTNFSNSRTTDGGRTFSTSCTSVKGAGVDRQWLAIDDNGGTAALGAGANDARAYFTYDNILQGTASGHEGDNQLVVNESNDGVNYGGGVGCTVVTGSCAAPAAVVTNEENIPGNILVDNTPGGKFQHSVYIAHSDSASDDVRISTCRGPATGPKTAATVAAACTDPTNFDPSDPGRVNPLWHDYLPRAKDRGVGVYTFVSIALDTKGGLYATWVEAPGSGVQSGPNRVYFGASKDGGVHWSTPKLVSSPSLNNNVFPWITAGDPGRVGIAWYGAPQAKEHNAFGPDSLDHGTWNVYYAQTLDGLAASPHFTQVKVSDHQVKFGNISTQGLGGSPDRSLGDYLQVQTGLKGEALVTYVDDTSNNRNADFTSGSGQSPPEAAGPTVVATQTGGPSLYTAVGTLTGDSRRPFGTVSDPVGKGFPDAFFSSAGQDIGAGGSNVDLRGVTVKQADAGHLKITLDTAAGGLAENLTVSPTLGGTTGEWVVRWAAPTYHAAGDGNIFYVGMESVSGQAPSYYVGSTDSLDTTHTKYFIYSKQKTVPGKILGSRIEWTVPLSDIGSPSRGQGLYSVTGFTATQTGPTVVLGSSPENGELSNYVPPNLIDATPPLDFRIGGIAAKPAVEGKGAPGGVSGSGGSGTGGGLATTGLRTGVPVLALLLLGVAAAVRRQRRQAPTK